jgi:hypothetical protein
MMEIATGSDQLTLRVVLRKTVIHVQKINLLNNHGK